MKRVWISDVNLVGVGELTDKLVNFLVKSDRFQYDSPEARGASSLRYPEGTHCYPEDRWDRCRASTDYQ